MPYTMTDFKREPAREYLEELTPEQRLQLISPEELLAALPAKQIEAYLKRLRRKTGTTRKKTPKRGTEPSWITRQR